MATTQKATIYHWGDLAEFTSETKEIHGGRFFEVRWVEGHRQGETAWTMRGPNGEEFH